MMNYNYKQPQNPLEDFRRFFRQGSGLSLLILANVSIWIVVQVLKVLLFFYNNPDDHIAESLVLHTLAIPASLPLLLLKPWTLITYMFLHTEFWHLLFNMLWLYWFGRIFLEFLHSRQLIYIYFIGGISGALFYVIAFNVFPVFSGMITESLALGASASVMAIVTAVSFYVPAYTIQLFLFGRIRILYLAILLFVFDFFMIPSGNAGGHLAHIGGAISGVVYIRLFSIINKSYHPGRTSPFFSNLLNFFQRKHPASYTTPDYSGRPVSDEEYNQKKRVNQNRVDEILEKISKGGYDCLTKEEKEFLFKTSKKR